MAEPQLQTRSVPGPCRAGLPTRGPLNVKPHPMLGSQDVTSQKPAEPGVGAQLKAGVGGSGCLALCVSLGTAPRLTIGCDLPCGFPVRREAGTQAGGPRAPRRQFFSEATRAAGDSLRPIRDALLSAPSPPTLTSLMRTRQPHYQGRPLLSRDPLPALRARHTADGQTVDGAGRRLSSPHSGTHSGRTVLRRREPQFKSWLRLASAV